MSNPTGSNKETPMTPGSIFETPTTPGGPITETPTTPGGSIFETPTTPTPGPFDEMLTTPTGPTSGKPKPASMMTEDEMLAFDRWSILYKKFRFEFFGASLDEAGAMLEKIKRQMDAEFDEIVNAPKGNGNKEYLDKLNNRRQFRNKRYDDMTNLLNKLKGGQALEHKELADFSERLNSELPGDAWIPGEHYGQAEKLFESLVSAVATEAKQRFDLEIKKRYDLPYNDMLMASIWKQKLQEFFRKNDGAQVKDIKRGVTTDDVDANLSKRVAQAVTAIYSGMLELPGLEIGDYESKPDAPYQTAQRLVQAVGSYAFLDHATRCYFIPNAKTPYSSVLDYYGNRKLGKDELKTTDEETAIIDDILNGNYEALPALEGIVRDSAQVDMQNKRKIEVFQKDYLDALNGQIQIINAGGKQQKQLESEDKQQKQLDPKEKRQAQIEADFKKLEDIKDNTRNFTKPDRKQLKTLTEKMENEEKELLDTYSRKWMDNKEAFNDKLEKHWNNYKEPDEATQLEKTIAAHLCSAYEPYRVGEGYVAKAVLTLCHQPRVPINDDSIAETVDYFKVMLEGGKNSEMIKHFDKINTDRIKQYYDTYILIREAEIQERDIADEYWKRKREVLKPEDLTLKSYVCAMSKLFKVSQDTNFDIVGTTFDDRMTKTPSMISRIGYNEKDWLGYLGNLVANNGDLRSALCKKLNLKEEKANVTDLANGFSKCLENGEYYYLIDRLKIDRLKDGKPDIASHNAKIECFEKATLPEQSPVNEYIRKKAQADGDYIKEKSKLDKTYANLKRGALVDPEHYNNTQLEALIEEKKQLPQNHPDIFAAHRKESAALTQTSNELLGAAQKINPGCTREEMLNMLLTTIGETKKPAEAKKKVMASTKKIKRYFFEVWFGAYRNPASTRLRTLLNGLAAKTKNEVSPDELMDLHKAAKDLKFSIDGGKKLSDADLKKLNKYDKERYALAKKVQTALENDKNMLFKDPEKAPVSNTPTNTPFGTPTDTPTGTPTPMSDTPTPTSNTPTPMI